MKSVVMAAATAVGLIASAKPFCVTENGKAKSEIVIGTNAVKSAKFAAAELQHVLRLVTGAELPIVKTASRPSGAIFVGCGTDETFVGEEYALREKAGNIVLAGNDSPEYGSFDYQNVKTFPTYEHSLHATPWAVYDFLEKYAGVRFYEFGDLGIAYRPQPSLTVELGDGYRRRPAMDAFRRPYFGSRVTKFMGVSPRDERLLQMRWRGTLNFGAANHSVMGIWFRYYKPANTPQEAKLFIESRPDYFAKGYEGKNAPNCLRRWNYPGDADLPPQLCTSSEGPVDYFTDVAIRMSKGEKFKGSYANTPIVKDMPFYFPVQEQDSGAWCQCDRCQGDPRLKSYLYRHFDWTSRIARRIAQTHPEIGVATLAYSDTLPYPNEIDLAPNLAVTICLGVQSWFHPGVYARQHGAYKDWVRQEAAKRPLAVWTYLLDPWGSAYPKGFFPFVYPHHMGRFAKEFATDGIRGYFAESMPEQHALEIYLLAKLADDPTLDPEALIDEYYDRYFGAAGPAMRNFADQLESVTYNITNQHEEVKCNTPQMSYVHGFHHEKFNWYVGTAERVRHFENLMKAADAAAVTPTERARVKRYRQRVWDQAVKGRADFEERERVRSIPLPLATATWKGSEPFWTRPFRTLDNKPAPYEAAASFSLDGNTLTLRYRENDGAALTHAKTDEDIWSNGIELFVAFRSGSTDYLQALVSPSGETRAYQVRVVEGVQRRDEVKLKKAKTEVSATNWTVAAEIPLNLIPVKQEAVPVKLEKGGYLQANVFRSRNFRDKTGVSTCWSPIFSPYYLQGLDRLAPVVLAEEPASGEIPFSRTVNLKDGKKWIPGDCFLPAGPGSKVTLDFEARGKVEGYAAIEQFCGRGYGASLIRETVKVTDSWKPYHVELTAKTVNPERPVTRVTPAFGTRDGCVFEVRNVRASVESPTKGHPREQ